VGAPTIGIDIGGTKIAAGVVDDTGEVIARRTIATEAADPRAIVAGATKVTQELLAAAPGVRAVGVGAAGLIDMARGVVLSAPNIAWEDVALGPMIADRVGLPVVVDNDANVAAYGEALHGAGRGIADQVMVTIGTGIGGGVIVGGVVVRGARGAAGEIGHMIIQADGGPPCACGNSGCFEALASGTAMGRRAREQAALDPAAAGMIERAGGIEAITGEAVGREARAGDVFAAAIVAETGRWLGIGLASLANLLDPALIVVGGGAVRDGDLLLQPARSALAERLLGRPGRKPPEVLPALLGVDAGVIGAGALARGA
jgi:glucokinase